MNLLVWNCRGLGNRRAVDDLGEIIQAKDLGIVFLSETWSTKEHIERIKLKLNFNGLFAVTNEARGGGLALMWNNNSDVWVDSFSSYHIDAIIKGGTEDAWRLIGLYGESEMSF